MAVVGYVPEGLRGERDRVERVNPREQLLVDHAV
jgi:hypothetical protein